jgi:hypothetical protein
MFVVIQHRISDPRKFWAIFRNETASLPPGLKLHAVLPDGTGETAVCLWEAESLQAVREFLEPLVSDISTNHYFEVDGGSAVGLPGQ